VQRASEVDAVVLAGIVSFTTTPDGSVAGPLFVSVIVYVVEFPAVTLVTPSDFASARSARFCTVVVALALLLLVTGSGSAALTVAVFVSTVPSATLEFTVTTIVNVVFDPTVTVPSVHVTVDPLSTH